MNLNTSQLLLAFIPALIVGIRRLYADQKHFLDNEEKRRIF
jgi:hypothetical protein